LEEVCNILFNTFSPHSGNYDGKGVSLKESLIVRRKISANHELNQTIGLQTLSIKDHTRQRVTAVLLSWRDRATPGNDVMFLKLRVPLKSVHSIALGKEAIDLDRGFLSFLCRLTF
jgi:hypothetical protein